MIDHRTAGFGMFLMRVSLGIMFLAHASLKIFVATPAGAAAFFGSLGLPPDLAYVVIAAETLGGAALVLGIWSRLVALLLTPILFGAIVTVHWAAGWLFGNPPHGGWEYLAFWIVGLVTLSLVGDGALALAPTPVPGRPVAVPA